MSTRDEWDVETDQLLQRFGFDAERFAADRARLARGEAGASQNRVRGSVEPPTEGDVRALPPPTSAERERLTARGAEAIRAGQVGMVVLAGGMATRFGGVVKAAVEAVDGQSFLDVKLADARQLATKLGAPVPVFLMTSFATDAEVRRLAEAGSSDSAPAHCFSQFISLRLRPDGELFIDADGKPSPYAPGHGDLGPALVRSGCLDRFIADGGRLLHMSNVDNLGATLDPAVLGAHLEAEAAVTAEVVAKEPGDAGGAPARVDGHLQIVESFRFPEGFDQDRCRVFNTNTFVLDAKRLSEPHPLTYFAVEKKVDGRPAIQFERLVGELTAFLPTAFLRVEREGVDGRFQPAKDPAELEARRPAIREILKHRGVL